MLIEKSGTDYTCCRIPGLAMTERGTLLGYYECRKELSDWADIDLKIIRSTDGGDTWETVMLINGKGNTLNNPMMVVKGDEIHFLYCENYKKLYHTVSTDDGKTFGKIRNMSEIFENGGFFWSVMAIGPGHGIVHDDNIILPVWFAYNEKRPKSHHPSFIATIYSADGENWKLGEVIGRDVLIDPSECALSVTKERKVLISIRNENPEHRRAFAVSETGYSGWKDLHFADNMPDPVCQGSMCHEGGKIYHINCESYTHRDNLTVKISEDCFESFESVIVDEVAGYSDIAVKDGMMYILYERNVGCDGLYFKKIPLK